MKEICDYEEVTIRPVENGFIVFPPTSFNTAPQVDMSRLKVFTSLDSLLSFLSKLYSEKK